MLHDDENAAASQQYFLLKKKKKIRRRTSSGKTIEQRQQRRMFYDSHCHLCKLGNGSGNGSWGAGGTRGASGAAPMMLIPSADVDAESQSMATSKQRRKFPTKSNSRVDPAASWPELFVSWPRSWAKRGIHSPISPTWARWLWATCFMISGGDLLSFDLKSSGQDTHQYMWLVIVCGDMALFIVLAGTFAGKKGQWATGCTVQVPRCGGCISCLL